MNILHLIPSLHYTGAAAQVGLLSKHLGASCDLRICCLGDDGPWAHRLRQQGRRVDCLHWTRTFDPTPLWKLRRLVTGESPDLIQVWGLEALRWLGWIGRRWLGRTIVAHPAPLRRPEVSRIDRWLLRRVGAVVAPSRAEADLCRQLGVVEARLRVVPPAVDIPQTVPPRRSAQPGPRIFCVGNLEPHKGWRDAVWAFDILRYVFKDARLVFVGDGPQRAYLEWFAQSLQVTHRVDFLGPCDEAAALLDGADICWAPAPRGAGRQAVLEAMAAGRPVVAADRLALRELIDDERTGFLIAPGDKVALCKRTRGLLLDAGLAQALGAAARQHVSRSFAADQVALQWRDVYRAA
jgi:glycosyltransferase involved in cell wall biosynthesis